MTWEPELDELAERQRLAAQMSGPEGVARQHGRGKLTVRERLPLLADPGTFREFGGLRGQGSYDDDGLLTGFTPQGRVEGMCAIDGRKVVVTAGDFTVRGGSGGGAHGGLGEELERDPADTRSVVAEFVDDAQCLLARQLGVPPTLPDLP